MAVPGTVAAVCVEEPIPVEEGMDGYLAVVFGAGHAATGERYTQACVSLAQCLVPAFLVREETFTGPTATKPFGGTIVLCSSTGP